ncbi:MAG: rRNA (guanine966-N2)-methyltransferase [Clostridia bacterium]|jgi:16S rRNA (guanine(966)-N(2))-methyltransferase RsmD|nr:rsmD [Clostridiales bacterium]MDK2986733.1 rRNA (guanine966-N2)-methyltransferase [Clostridia bacterium]
MRVISGEYKGRRLKAPKGIRTRPTTDRVKEAIFNTLAPILKNCHSFLDLFAGSGAIGIEALSRGVNRCIFVENWSGALKILRENLKICSNKEIIIYPIDVNSALEKIQNERFDIIFMDPPYNMPNIIPLLKKIDTVVQPDGIVVLEASTKNDYPQSIENLTCIKTSRYGDTQVLYFKKVEDFRGG